MADLLLLHADTDGKVFQQVIAPFSARVAKAGSDSKRPVVNGCVAANLVATPATLVTGSQPQLQPPPPAANSDAAVQSAPSAAGSSANAAKLAAAVQSLLAAQLAPAAKSGAAVQSAPTAAIQSALGPASAKTGGGLPVLASAPAQPAPVQSASAVQPAAVLQAMGAQSAAKGTAADAAGQAAALSVSNQPVQTVATPATLALPAAAAGRKLRAAATTQLPVRISPLNSEASCLAITACHDRHGEMNLLCVCTPLLCEELPKRPSRSQLYTIQCIDYETFLLRRRQAFRRKLPTKLMTWRQWSKPCSCLPSRHHQESRLKTSTPRLCVQLQPSRPQQQLQSPDEQNFRAHVLYKNHVP